jgi:tRNA (guanine-N7-)-methyltransferase
MRCLIIAFPKKRAILMSKRNKLQKFAELDTFTNVYQCHDIKTLELFAAGRRPVEMRGQWHAHFGNQQPITLELACGKGDYTLALARCYPERNFVGVDVKGARIWRGAITALENGLQNVAFLRTRIEKIAAYFGEEEVAEIWITFPDPFLRDSQSNRRLTAPVFLAEYRRILQKGGIMHLKTDDPTLYAFTLETLEAEPNCRILYHDSDIYAKPLPMPELDIKTFYEQDHLSKGRTIKYVRFCFED